MARDVTRQSKVVPAAGLLALALGAAAFGALAIGALAIGRIAVGRMVIKKARFGALQVDELTVLKSGNFKATLTIVYSRNPHADSGNIQAATITRSGLVPTPGIFCCAAHAEPLKCE